MNPFVHVKDFCLAETGWTFAFVFSNLLFWCYGFIAATDYGWSDAEKMTGADGGGIPSGPSGSGVVPITTLLFIVGTGTWLSKLAGYQPKTE
ncbi:hypothetical protein TeGR_g2503 [Tetraparma gracilis]|uniref:Uncharacterized protein n=1 Tax=Tetraparma gracilis TaxID=2962635 RepID=A0ABQ6N9E3_9STRA|nr:hypothetical protein TeGR_g2503 [Tetraparma gracilis]